MGNQRSSMLLFLSKYNDGGKTDPYTYAHNGKEYKFEGDQTNDAPTKCLIKIAQEINNPIDTIICIVSEEVFTKRITPDNQTAFERFKDMIATHCSEEYYNDYKINIIPIGYDFKVPPEFENGKIYHADSLVHIPESEERYLYIYKKVEEKLGLNMKPENSGEKTERIIYIDYTGGLRDSSLFMIALIRYLEFRGIICKDIIYSDFFSKPKTIRNIRYIYDMFDMINGVSEFVGTGNAQQLVDLQKKLENTTNNDIVKTFVKTLQDFSNAIAICDVSKIQTTIESISTAINTLENDTSDDIFVQMFKTLIPTVKEKLYIGKEPPSILDLSQWCLENNMLQQAVTIYNEKILFYYYDHYTEFYNEFKNGQSYNINKKEAKDLWSDFNKYIRNKTLYDGLNLTKIIENDLNNKIRDLSEKYKENFQENPDLLINDLKINHISLWNAIEDIFKTTDPKKNITKNDLLSCIFYGSNSAEIKKVKANYKQIAYITASLDALEKNNKELWKAMKYYHAIKILRNNINHVSGDVGGMNAKMQEYLEEKGLGDTAIAAGKTFEFKLEKVFISETLKAAIEFSKDICKN